MSKQKEYWPISKKTAFMLRGNGYETEEAIRRAVKIDHKQLLRNIKGYGEASHDEVLIWMGVKESPTARREKLLASRAADEIALIKSIVEQLPNLERLNEDQFLYLQSDRIDSMKPASEKLFRCLRFVADWNEEKQVLITRIDRIDANWLKERLVRTIERRKSESERIPLISRRGDTWTELDDHMIAEAGYLSGQALIDLAARLKRPRKDIQERAKKLRKESRKQ